MWNSRGLQVVTLVVVSVLSLSDVAFGRMRWPERDGKPVPLHPRRFRLELPPVIDRIAAACPSATCGILAGSALVPLLSLQPACSQQDFADSIISASRKFHAVTRANMIALAIEYLQTEKNTPLDFTTNPPTRRNSVFCQRGPANLELNGLFQTQDPANDPHVFFDPVLGMSVLKRTQPNTEPFGGAGARSNYESSIPAPPAFSAVASLESPSPTQATLSTPVPACFPPTPTNPTPAGNIGNFGSCSVPEIEFGPGFDNRKETSYQPANKTSYNHGSAQNIDIISQFICDTLVNSCGADQTARTTCASARAAADQQAPKTGAQADAFNAVFGIKTNFSAIMPLDDQGRSVTSSGPVSSSPNSTASTASGPANFGKCSMPEIKFAAGLDGRKETAFAPMDPVSYNHGSADNIGVITQFMCNALTNTCGANEAAKELCNSAEAAANAATPLTGAQADAFNAAVGQKTDFASVTPIDNTGKPVVSHDGSS